jgi:TPP-dependent pyruvate/acetoin dehydrogenase alpha subunit
VTRKKLAEIEKQINAKIDAAVQFARESEFPVAEEMYADVYV